MARESLKLFPGRSRRDCMYLDPGSLFMLVLLVGVSGFVARGLLVTWHKVTKGDSQPAERVTALEERLRKVEAATSSLLVDVSGMREKQRFMHRLQEGTTRREPAYREREPTVEAGPSPLMTQNIPIVPRSR